MARQTSFSGIVLSRPIDQDGSQNSYLLKILSSNGEERMSKLSKVIFGSRSFEKGQVISGSCFKPGWAAKKGIFVCNYLLPSKKRVMQSGSDYFESGYFHYLKKAEINKIKADINVDLMLSDLTIKNAYSYFGKYGISSNRSRLIALEWNLLKGSRQDWTLLRRLDQPINVSNNIVQYFSDHSPQIISKTPYAIAKVKGVGFKSADSIATGAGIEEDSNMREFAAITDSTDRELERGHTLTMDDVIIHGLEKNIGYIGGKATDVIARMVGRGDLNTYNFNGACFLGDPDAISREVRTLQLAKKLQDPSRCKNVPAILDRFPFPFSEDQKRAIIGALSNPISIVVGGPGTGKTSAVAKTIIESLEEAGEVVAIATPTGKASRRIAQEVGREAVTLSSLFFSKKELNFTTLIIDESSMIDASNAQRLLEEVDRRGVRLIILGDPDQLPPVSYGNFLKDMLDSNSLPKFELTTVFRQLDEDGKENDIKVNARKINNGERPSMERNMDGSFHWIDAKTDEEIAKKISAFIDYIPHKMDIPVKSIQVITPQNNTLVGVNKLNQSLANQMNPGRESKNSIYMFGENFFEGDSIMQTRADKSMRVSNGDTGRIKSIDIETQRAVIDFDGRDVTIEFKKFNFLRLANAITVHKSQGSEYEAVIIPVTKSHKRMLAIDLLMTAATRGKKQVFLVGSREAMDIALENAGEKRRRTWMALSNGLKSPTLKKTRKLESKSKKLVVGF